MTFCEVFRRLHWQKLFLRLSSSMLTKILVEMFLEHGTIIKRSTDTDS